MNFGDILEQWEKQSAGAAGKKKTKAPSAPAPVPQERTNPLDVWLRIHGVYDKDAEAEEAACGRPHLRRRLRLKKTDAALDIHGLTRDEAWEELEHFFNEARRGGLEKITIIHGKGNHSNGESVLKRCTRDFIERCPFAGESDQEKGVYGGSGATWVLLKR